jgi:hypothetical protein
LCLWYFHTEINTCRLGRLRLKLGRRKSRILWLFCRGWRMKLRLRLRERLRNLIEIDNLDIRCSIMRLRSSWRTRLKVIVSVI